MIRPGIRGSDLKQDCRCRRHAGASSGWIWKSNRRGQTSAGAQVVTVGQAPFEPLVSWTWHPLSAPRATPGTGK